MPSFKPKTNKKIKVPHHTTITLDSKHYECLKEFEDNDEYFLPKIKKELNYLKKEKEKNILNIEKSLEIEEKINMLIKEKKKLKQQKMNYFLDNSKYIFEYFENKKNISNTTTDTKTCGTKENALNNLFNISKEVDSSKAINNNNTINNTEGIIHKYLSNIDDSLININLFVRQTDICTYCGKGEFIPIDDEGIRVCNNEQCGASIQFLTENEKPSYKEPPKELCFYAYKKINHFKEILSQYQGKETTNISEEILDQIRSQIKKERIEVTDLTHNKTKELLKKLGLNKYYEHIVFIKNKLGIKPPLMSQELETTLCNLFIELQSPYSKHCPDYRVNFLNYYYVLYKLCELLNETRFLSEIPMLKDREKLIEQDEIWKKMCMELDWEFIPTI